MNSELKFNFYTAPNNVSDSVQRHLPAENPLAEAVMNLDFQEFIPKQSEEQDNTEASSEDDSKTPRSIPSSPTFKFHPSSARPSSPDSEWNDEPEFVLPPPVNIQFNHITAEDILVDRPKAPFSQPVHKKFKWESMNDAQAWMAEEQERKMFSFALKDSNRPRALTVDWQKRHIYVCSRGSSGGKKLYKKKYAWTRKVPHKATGCRCRLTLTTHSDGHVTATYAPNHNHALGIENARFTAIPESTRREIEDMLRQGVLPSKVLQQIHRSVYDERNLAQLRSGASTRNDFVTRADVRRIEKAIEQETIRLARNDGESVLKWVERLRQEGHYVFLKKSCEAPPPSSGLAPDAFVLIIQTRYQQEFWQKHGGRFAGIDATHNTTHYENTSLFTLLGRDRWGHGMPCAWMVSSNSTEDTISCFLQDVRRRFPAVVPEYFMSDKDNAQMNAIQRHYPESMLELCWWHVLHAWQQHFSISAFPELWALMKTWVRINDAEEFQERWRQIEKIAPESVVDYLKTHWLPIKHLWSAVHRVGRTIYQKCDTNMLVEAWHHLLKGKFMQGKRNRRLDQLIHIYRRGKSRRVSNLERPVAYRTASSFEIKLGQVSE